jgi:hypothetical protein
MARFALRSWLALFALASSAGAQPQDVMRVAPASVFPVEIVGADEAIPVTIETDDDPIRVEVVNPPPVPLEVFTTNPLSVEVLSSAPAICSIPHFTVLGFTNADFRGGELGGPLGAAQKCQSQFGDGAVMCRAEFVRTDHTAIPMAGPLSAWIDSIGDGRR